MTAAILNFPPGLPPKVIDIIDNGCRLAAEEVATSRRQRRLDEAEQMLLAAAEYRQAARDFDFHGNALYPLWRPW